MIMCDSLRLQLENVNWQKVSVKFPQVLRPRLGQKAKFGDTSMRLSFLAYRLTVSQ